MLKGKPFTAPSAPARKNTKAKSDSATGDSAPVAGITALTAPDPDIVRLDDVLPKKSPKGARGAKNAKPAKPDAKNAPAAKRAAKESKPAKAPKPAKEPKPKKTSGLDAAYRVLLEAKEPMTCGDMVQTMLDKALWFTKGATPSATIYAAIIREIAAKGKASRFTKTDRGMFTANASAGSKG